MNLNFSVLDEMSNSTPTASNGSTAQATAPDTVKRSINEAEKEHQDSYALQAEIQESIAQGTDTEDITQLFLKAVLAYALAINRYDFYENIAQRIEARTGVTMA